MIDTGDRVRMLDSATQVNPGSGAPGSPSNSLTEGALSIANNSASTSQALPESDDAISLALVSARMCAAPLSDFPGAVPNSMGQAYAIQTASIARWPDTVAGWKVGMLSPTDQERYSAERLAGPIFASQVHVVSTGSSTAMPIYVGGFAAIEAEFVFRLGSTIEPSEREWSDEDLAGLVASLHTGAELASSPMAEINNLGPTVIVSDFGNNAGLLLGPEITNWQSVSPADMPSRVLIDGSVVGDASAAAIPGSPIAALGFIVSHAAERGLALPAGTLISTGAATGIHNVEAGSVARVEFGNFGRFEVSFEPMSGGQ